MTTNFQLVNNSDSDDQDEAKYSKAPYHNNDQHDSDDDDNADSGYTDDDSIRTTATINDPYSAAEEEEMNVYAYDRVATFNRKARHWFCFMLVSTGFWVLNLGLLVYVQVAVKEFCSISIQLNEGALCIVTYLIMLYALDSAILGSAYTFSRDILAGNRLPTVNHLLDGIRPHKLSALPRTVDMGRNVLIKRLRWETQLPITSSPPPTKNKESLTLAMEQLRRIFDKPTGDDADTGSIEPSKITISSLSLTSFLLTANAVPLLSALVFLFLGVGTITEVHNQSRSWPKGCFLIYAYDWFLVAVIFVHLIVKLVPIAKRCFPSRREYVGIV
jgi:hypothetical protein